ncbi:hypothetical protein ACFQ9X_49785 [Catenulispora yoronensis]
MPRHNGEQHIMISELPVHKYALIWAGEHVVPHGMSERKQAALREERPAPSVVCPSCGHWGMLHRGMLRGHCVHGRRDHGCAERCGGSGQRYILDVGFQDWSNRLAQATASTDTRSSKAPRGFPIGFVCREPKFPVPVPVPVCRR